MTDTLRIECPYCERELQRERVPTRGNLPPWRAVRWHEQMVRHIRRQHMRKPHD